MPDCVFSRLISVLMMMMMMMMMQLMLAVSILLGLVVRTTIGIEYCLTETFHARCRHPNDVILMNTARFGRMELGRCVTRNFGHVGCAADVINQLDSACSGRHYCDLSVSDPSLVRMKPCPKDFSAYLDATYHCVPVISTSIDECRLNGRQKILTDGGYISSTSPTAASSPYRHHQTSTAAASPPSSSADDVATTLCPFVFDLDPGQRLTLTLIDFAPRNLTGQLLHGMSSSSSSSSSSSAAAVAAGAWDVAADGHSSEMCLRYLVIDEPTIGSTVTVCGGVGRHGSLHPPTLPASAAVTSSASSRRERHVYTSRTTSVHVHLLAPSMARFLLKFQVTGCYNPPWLPPDSHAKYHADQLVVVCNHSSESFVLVCMQDGGRRQWIGELKNCSKPPIFSAKSNDVTPYDTFGMPHIGWSLAIVVGVATVTVVYVAVVITCVLHIRKWRCKLHAVPPVKLDRYKPEMTSQSSGSSPPFTERTAMVGIKQAVYRTASGLTYSELFQLKPQSTSSSSPSTAAALRQCSRQDVKYSSPTGRLSSVTVVQPATSSRFAYYDTPYCAWCHDATPTYGHVMMTSQANAAAAIERCRSPSDNVEDDDCWFGSRDVRVTTSCSQIDVVQLADDEEQQEEEFGREDQSVETSPDVVMRSVAADTLHQPLAA